MAMRVLENLEVVGAPGKKAFRCIRCGYMLGRVTENYRERLLRHEEPISKYQPIVLKHKMDWFVLREYYCPQCATMVEVEMVAKGEKETASILLKD